MKFSLLSQKKAQMLFFNLKYYVVGFILGFVIAIILVYLMKFGKIPFNICA